MIYVICYVNGQEVPATISKHFDLFKDKIYDTFVEEHPGISVIEGDGWWLPFDDDLMFRYYLPTGQEQNFASVGKLREELEQINSIEWNADEETIVKWRDEEGYPDGAVIGTDRKVRFSKNPETYDTVSLAKFAFSILWQAMRHAEQYGTVIIYDF